MKFTIEIDVTDEYTKRDVNRILHRDDPYLALWDFDQELRRVIRGSEDEESVKHAEAWRAKLREILVERRVDIDD